MASPGFLMALGIPVAVATSGSASPDAFPEASSCVTVTACESLGEWSRYSSGNGFLVSVRDGSGQCHVFALTARHVVEGCDWAKVTVRAPGLSGGLGRIDIAVDPGTGVFHTPSDDLDLVAICLDSALAQDRETSDIVNGMALQEEQLATTASMGEGDTLLCLVRPIEPMLWGRIGDLECIPGVVMPGHPEDGSIYVDLFVDHGYSGGMMLADGGAAAGCSTVVGMLVARYISVEDYQEFGPGRWLALDPREDEVLFGQVIPSGEILDLLGSPADD